MCLAMFTTGACIDPLPVFQRKDKSFTAIGGTIVLPGLAITALAILSSGIRLGIAAHLARMFLGRRIHFRTLRFFGDAELAVLAFFVELGLGHDGPPLAVQPPDRPPCSRLRTRAPYCGAPTKLVIAVVSVTESTGFDTQVSKPAMM